MNDREIFRRGQNAGHTFKVSLRVKSQRPRLALQFHDVGDGAEIAEHLMFRPPLKRETRLKDPTLPAGGMVGVVDAANPRGGKQNPKLGPAGIRKVKRIIVTPQQKAARISENIFDFFRSANGTDLPDVGISTQHFLATGADQHINFTGGELFP